VVVFLLRNSALCGRLLYFGEAMVVSFIQPLSS
jgi:hypothetical protein